MIKDFCSLGQLKFDIRGVNVVELVRLSKIENYPVELLAHFPCWQDCPLSDSDACHCRQRGASFFHTLSFVVRGFLPDLGLIYYRVLKLH